MSKHGFALLLLVALAACGRVENTDKPMPDQASVEINRQGMEGAQDARQAQGVENNTARMGAGRSSIRNHPQP